MSATSPPFVGWLLHSVLGGGFLPLVALPLMAICRQPARRQRVGEAALLAALALCLLNLAPPWIMLPLLGPAPAHVSAETLRSLASSPRFAPPQPEEGIALLEQEFREPGLVAPSHEELADSLDPSASVANSRSESSSADLNSADGNAAQQIYRSPWGAAAWASDIASTLDLLALPRWLTLVALAYATAGAFLLGRWLVGHFALWRLLRGSHPAPEAVSRLFETMVGGHNRRPRLLLSSRLRVPLSCGLLRPCVVVPASLADANAPGPLRWVFAHELTHLKRGDPWTCLLFGLGQVFYFCLPWFWWLRRQVRLCQEYIADAAAAEQAADVEDYAQFLVNLTQAPTAPLGALSVSGNSSDLFRRVTMLLQSPFRVEKCCPCWWSLATGCGLIGLAILVSGVSLRASAAAAPDEQPAVTPVAVDAATPIPDEDKADPTEKKQSKKKPALEKVLRDLEELLKDLPDVADADQVKRLEEELKQLKPEVLKQELLERQPLNLLRNNLAEGELPKLGEATGQNLWWHGRNEGRLGVQVQKPSPVLAEQLDLPKGEGLVIEHVLPQSAAAKAGLKANDVLLEFNGKPVPDDVAKFVRMLQEVKADTPVDAVVLRKGKKRTIKGLSLPEAKANPTFQWGVAPGVPFPGQPGAQPPLNLLPPGQHGPLNLVQPNFQFQGFGGSGNRGVITTIIRSKDSFTTRYQEGSLIITLTGNVTDGKSKVKQIQIQDGGKTETYDGAERVPEQYRDKVKNLIEMSEKNNLKIEVGTELQRRGANEGSDRRSANKTVTITLEKGNAADLAETLKRVLPQLTVRPVTVTAFGNKLIASSEDAQALKLVRELSRLLQGPGEGDFEIIRLKRATASDAAKTLDSLFNGDSKKNPSRVRVVADPATNALLVRANPLDMLTIRRLLDVIDKTGIKVWTIGPLKQAKAKDVASTIKAIYEEHLQSTLLALRSGALRNANFGWGGLNLHTDESRNPRPVDLTVTYDEQTNSVIVSCNEEMFREIEKLVEQLDKAAQNQTTVPSVPPGGIDWSQTNGAQVGQAPRNSRNRSAAEAAR